MNKTKKVFISSLICASLLASPLGYSRDLTANSDLPSGFGFAISIPQAAGETKNVLNQGFGFDLDYSWRKPDSIFGFRIDGIYSGFGLTDKVIENVNHADDGYANIWGIGTSLMLTPKGDQKIKPRIYGGPGFYYQFAEATRYTSGSSGYVCDPWWGCYETYGGQASVAHRSTSRLGWQGGAGLEFCIENAGAITLDVQYVMINNTNANTEFMPINIGYEWRF